MSVVGIISEYNPFHNGHKLHVEMSKAVSKAEYVVSVMSGNFVQRGEPAIFDKQLRTKVALQNGVDLVIELPVFSACAAGEYFAEGALNVLNATNIVDSICFGSECGEIAPIKRIADMMTNESTDISNAIKHGLSNGLSFPTARAKAFALQDETIGKIMESPNNILAIEYLKAIHKTKSHIKPYTVQRILADYHSEQITGGISSATAVRKALTSCDTREAFTALPENAHTLYANAINMGNVAIFDNLSHILHYILKTKSPEQIASSLDISEGLENRIIAAAEEHYKISDIILKAKTKRYTLSKIRRIILQILLDISAENFNTYRNRSLPYIRVLGFKKSAEHLLKELYRESSVPVITNLKKAEDILCSKGRKMLGWEMKTTDIYYMSQNSYFVGAKRGNVEFGLPLIIV